MNINLLIDAVVRQTTVLIAQLATTAGARAPLAHTANQVFMNLVAELRDQGVGNKVIADMFGLSLRTYHNQVARLSEGRSVRGRSLWAAVLAYLQDRPVTRRAEVLLHFHKDDEATVKGVLRDLTDSGIVYRSGKGDAVSYRVADPNEQAGEGGVEPREALASLVWVAVHRFGPASPADIASQVPAAAEELQQALDGLVAAGKIRIADGGQADGATPTYCCDDCVIALGDEAGWEAAVFDHYQAMVTAICAKLRQGTRSAQPGEQIGGSTYTYDIWPGHPMEHEVMGALSTLRKTAVELRTRLEDFNATLPAERAHATRVITYVGQTVLRNDDERTDDDGDEAP